MSENITSSSFTNILFMFLSCNCLVQKKIDSTISTQPSKNSLCFPNLLFSSLFDWQVCLCELYVCTCKFKVTYNNTNHYVLLFILSQNDKLLKLKTYEIQISKSCVAADSSQFTVKNHQMQVTYSEYICNYKMQLYIQM